MVELRWATIASILYFSIYLLLLFGLAFHVHRTEYHSNKKSFAKAIWNKRGIYGHILVHLYDTATDIGVLIEWGILAQLEIEGENIESINMVYLFWTSIAFILIYRLVSVLIGCCSTHYEENDNITSYICNTFLGIIDMYVLKVVYYGIKDDAKEPTTKQKMIQLTESLLESLPQIVLQSVYIIRSQNSNFLKNETTLYLVGLSLLASLFSIANKYIWIDKDCVSKDAQEAKLSTKAPFMNPLYMLRVIWRFGFVATRFAIFSLLWSVLGGAFLVIFIPFSWLLWTVLIYIQIHLIQDTFVGNEKYKYFFLFGYGFLSLTATPAYNSVLFAIGHAIEMILVMSVITVFAISKSTHCGICTDPAHRTIDNPYILTFIIFGWISMIIDFITYYIMLQYELFGHEEDGVFNVFTTGIQDQKYKYEWDQNQLHQFLDGSEALQTIWWRFTGKTNVMKIDDLHDILYASLVFFCTYRDPDMPSPPREQCQPFIVKMTADVKADVFNKDQDDEDLNVTFEEFKLFGKYMRDEYAKLQEELNAIKKDAVSV